jgi:ATP-dependent Clp protease ATP-binding subunit ClpC
MFEKYTEKARRVIFFARYEASQFGSPVIETEHLLLGLIREDKNLTARFLPKSGTAIQDIRKEIEGRTLIRDKVSTSVDLPFSEECKRVLNHAAEESAKLSHKHIGTEHLLLGLISEEKSFASELLREHGLRPSLIREELIRSFPEKHTPSRSKEPLSLLEFSRDLTETADNDALDPLIGREPEIERLIQILCRRTKNNPVLIGEPGVGKTAIVEGLAQKIVTGQVPRQLLDKRLIALDLSLIVAGTKYRGQFEERLKTIMKELVENKKFIVFIDELHTLVGAGSAEGSLDAANILKPALSRGEIQCIGSTTPGEYRRSIEKDRSLERRFQAIKVSPPSEEESIAILNGIKEKYELFHQLRYTDEAIQASVYLSNRYIPDRFLPDKAIDILDEAGARVKLRKPALEKEKTFSQRKIRGLDIRMGTMLATEDSDDSGSYWLENAPASETPNLLREHWNIKPGPSIKVTKNDIEQIIAKWTGIPITSLQEEETTKLLHMEDELHKRLISQDRAINALSRAIRRSRAGLKSPKRPVGSFLFLGPTGVGKTEMARALAAFLFGSEQALIRLDMSEYMEKHSVSRLIGSPPGYVGHEDGGQLTEKIKHHPYSILLLDEIEKAHPDVFNILLQVFEDGRLTDSHGNTVDFKNTIIILTSNIGARFLEKRGSMGFQSGKEADIKHMEALIHSEVKRIFNPEFLNRIDEIILFESLNDQDFEDIVGLLIGLTNEVMKDKKIFIQLTPEAKRWIVQKTCHDRSYGARPLRRAIQKYIEDPLSEALLRNRIRHGAVIEIFPNDDSLYFIHPGDPVTSSIKLE